MSNFISASRPNRSTIAAPVEDRFSLVGLDKDSVRAQLQKKVLATVDGSYQSTGEYFLNGVVAKLFFFWTTGKGKNKVDHCAPFEDMHCNLSQRKDSSAVKLGEYLTNNFIETLSMDDQVEYRFKLIDAKTGELIAGDLPQLPRTGKDYSHLPEHLRSDFEEASAPTTEKASSNASAWLFIYVVKDVKNPVTGKMERIPEIIGNRDIPLSSASKVEIVRKYANNKDLFIAPLVVPQAKLEAWAVDQASKLEATGSSKAA